MPAPRVRAKPETYAITLVTHNRRRLFQRADMVNLFLSTLTRYRSEDRFQLHAFAIMPDHVHLLLTPAPDHTIERLTGILKGGFSHAARTELTGTPWQPGYHAHRITSPEDLANQTRYIANNPTHPNHEPYTHLTHPALIDQPDDPRIFLREIPPPPSPQPRK